MLRIPRVRTAARPLPALRVTDGPRPSQVVIRFLFFDGAVLQANFRPGEPVTSLYALLRDLLRPDAPTVELSITPPRRVLSATDTRTLFDAGLAPAAIVRVATVPPRVPTADLLPPSLLASAVIGPPAPPPARSVAVAAAAAAETAMAESGSQAASAATTTTTATTTMVDTDGTHAHTTAVPRWFQLGRK